VLPLSVGAGAAPFVFLSDGLPTGVANRIGAAVPRIYVVGRRAQRRRPPTNATELRALGSELGARYLLAGSIAGTRSDTRIVVTLFSAASGKQVWQRAFMYDSTGALGLEQATAIEVASRIVGPLTATEVQLLRRVPTTRRAAYEWVLRGDAETDDPAAAAEAYRRAVQIDPRFAGGFARLALADATLLETGAMASDASCGRRSSRSPPNAASRWTRRPLCPGSQRRAHACLAAAPRRSGARRSIARWLSIR
jgi:TolB-like protein